MARCEALDINAADVGIGRARWSLSSKWIKALLVILLMMAVAVQADVTPAADTVKATAIKPDDKPVIERLKWVPFDSVRASFPVAPRPLFLYIAESGCEHCAYMDTAVFNRPEIARYLNHNLTPVKVDIYMDMPIKVRDTVLNESEFRKLLAIEGTPAYYFFSATGQVIGLLDSQMDLLTFKRMLVYVREAHFYRTPWVEFLKLPEAGEAAINKRFEGK